MLRDSLTRAKEIPADKIVQPGKAIILPNPYFW